MDHHGCARLQLGDMDASAVPVGSIACACGKSGQLMGGQIRRGNHEKKVFVEGLRKIGVEHPEDYIGLAHMRSGCRLPPSIPIKDSNSSDLKILRA